MKKYFYFIPFLLLIACDPLTQPNPSTSQEIKFEAPQNFPALVFQDEVTPKNFALGKKLFYDPILSVDSSVSCATCHQQKGAFAQIDHDLSHGVFNLLGNRNSPSIQNLAWQSQFFWDGGTLHLDAQPLAPIENPVEMGEHLTHVIHKLRRHKDYPKLFGEAFGLTDTTQINTAYLGKALALFMKMLVSNQSKYDQYLANKVTLSGDEQTGLALFQQKCETCHSGILFTDLGFHNNGITTTQDSGRARITQQPQDLYKFKTPTLRNIEKSYPYMHDGRFSTLESVLNHYAGGVIATPNLAPELQQGGQLGIPLSNTEKQQIIAFLKTLTDDAFLNDKRFSED